MRFRKTLTLLILATGLVFLDPAQLPYEAEGVSAYRTEDHLMWD